MSDTPLSVAHVASEMTPLIKVGGLADVVGALAAEQARRGHRVTVALPAYQAVSLPAGWSSRALDSRPVPWGMGRELARFALASGPDPRLRVLLVDHAGDRSFFDRPGIYDDPRSGEGYPDNAERFLFFCRAALEGLKLLKERFDVLHGHDHQAAWTMCFVRTHELHTPTFKDLATVFTIHNLGYQGIYDPWVLGLAGLGGELFYPASPFEYWGRVNYMKVGLVFADLLSTVSPRYAQEIQTGGEFGAGLEGVLARRAGDLRGILNGIDDAYWDPAADPYLAHRYGPDRMEGKELNRRALIKECGFPSAPEMPLVGMVSRLAEQKGFDLIEQGADALLALGARYVVLGSGEARYQDLFRRLMAAHPDRVHYRSGFDERFAHLIEAGCDLFLMPSRYEPCGLNQMYSLRYGTPPIVRAVGGLADTVQEFDPLTGAGNGFVFQRFDAEEMLAAVRRGLATCRQPGLCARLRRNGMGQDFSWRRSVDRYDALYGEARERVAAGRIATLESVRATI